MIFFNQDNDPVIPKLGVSSEEAKKVTRNGGQKLTAIFRRIEDRYSHANSNAN